mmetsp:Transcript_155025/g.282010  ORF Transcript_155025/g.282010 Transcript_155025/m.282010 type:complete len:86 (-) Transcript_155025:703-960(-)
MTNHGGLLKACTPTSMFKAPGLHLIDKAHFLGSVFPKHLAAQLQPSLPACSIPQRACFVQNVLLSHWDSQAVKWAAATTWVSIHA